MSPDLPEPRLILGRLFQNDGAASLQPPFDRWGSHISLDDFGLNLPRKREGAANGPLEHGLSKALHDRCSNGP